MSNQPNWKTEFPAFPLSDMPELPPGFVDISWHNDACPNFHNAALGLCVFVDYLNPAMRDYPDTERFTLYRVDENSVTAETILNSDCWQDILAAIELESFTGKSTDSLSDMYGDWLARNGFDDSLPVADLIHAHGAELTAAQKEWLAAFSAAYEAQEAREDAAHKTPIEGIPQMTPETADKFSAVMSALSDAYGAWLADNFLPEESADELLLGHADELTADQRAFLARFIALWEAAELLASK